MTTNATKTVALLLPNGNIIPIRHLGNGHVVAACGKCQGTGYIPAFGYHDSGVCYDCQGVGHRAKSKVHASEGAMVEYLVAKAEADERKRTKAEAAAEAKWLAEAPAREAKRLADEAAEAQAKLERETKLASQSHLDGAFGERVAFSGVVTLSRQIDGHYGPSVLTVVKQADGSEVKFFSTAKFAWALEVDDEVSLTGEIAGWDTYGDAKQTTVKRAKLA